MVIIQITKSISSRHPTKTITFLQCSPLQRYFKKKLKNVLLLNKTKSL